MSVLAVTEGTELGAQMEEEENEMCANTHTLVRAAIRG